MYSTDWNSGFVCTYDEDCTCRLEYWFILSVHRKSIGQYRLEYCLILSMPVQYRLDFWFTLSVYRKIYYYRYCTKDILENRLIKSVQDEECTADKLEYWGTQYLDIVWNSTGQKKEAKTVMPQILVLLLQNNSLCTRNGVIMYFIFSVNHILILIFSFFYVYV